MIKLQLKIARGYDPRTQSTVGFFAAQLNDRLTRLKKEVKGLTVEQLEWQERPGMNTIGMLLAHLSIVEVWWIRVAPAGIPFLPEGKKLVQKICGIEDDGLPLPPDGSHPPYLKGFTADQYLAVIARGRRAVNAVMKKWRDKDLDELYACEDARFSRAWTLYHVLEHFCGHMGQILLLKHMMRDAGVPAMKD